MNRLLLILILMFSFQSWTTADDIRDFQIEGMSIGDSLLDFFDEKKISNSVVDWYDSLEKNRYLSLAFDSSKFTKYDFVDIWTKYDDKEFKIVAIAGVNYFGKDSLIADIDECYLEQINIANEISKLFINSKIDGPHKIIHTDDPSGNSTYTDIYFKIDEDYEALVSCYDWNDDLENKGDHIYITLRSFEFEKWLP